MTLDEMNQMSAEELQALTRLCVVAYSYRVRADWKDIKRLVDGFHYHQMQIEEALRELEREDY